MFRKDDMQQLSCSIGNVRSILEHALKRTKKHLHVQVAIVFAIHIEGKSALNLQQSRKL
jgi:hypothetical protein